MGKSDFLRNHHLINLFRLQLSSFWIKAGRSGGSNGPEALVADLFLLVLISTVDYANKLIVDVEKYRNSIIPCCFPTWIVTKIYISKKLQKFQDIKKK
jgi:hypothetical protein